MRTFYAMGICFFLLVSGVLWAQEKKPQQGNQQTQTTSPSTAASSAPTAPHPFVITAEEKARKNPVKFTEDSVAKGKHLFLTQCAMCHGKTGDGKGDLTAVMHISPSDFTKPDTLAGRTDGELFTIIDNGSLSMPAQGKRLKENQTWDLVNFLRVLAGKTPAKSAGTAAGDKQP
ncbi:MAG TPA: c-type cytochrome [Terriglobia bacterium]|nr:c-type cytochrome [Terriglobia bacterium]